MWVSERTKGCWHIFLFCKSSIWSNKQHFFKINLHQFHTNRFVFRYVYDFLLLKIQKFWSSEKSTIQPYSSFLISRPKIVPRVCASYSRKYIKPKEKNAIVQQQRNMIIYGKQAVKGVFSKPSVNLIVAPIFCFLS